MATEIIDVAKAYGLALIELGKKNSRVVTVETDLADSCMSDLFRDQFPERSIEVGLAEATAVEVGAGMALSGKIPFVNTFAVFAAARTFDQVRQTVAYGKVNLKIVGSAGGLSLGYAGASHHSIEDLALMRALPNMTVVVPADSEETRQMVFAIAELEGPVYMRLSRVKKPPLFDSSYHLVIGQAVILQTGSDVSLIATGDMVFEALEATKTLEQKGYSVEVINVHTLKPLDTNTITASAKKTGAVVTIEDHNIIGGLAGAVAECLAENAPTPMRRIGLRDTFCESDNTNVLREAYGMTAHFIVDAAEEVMNFAKRIR